MNNYMVMNFESLHVPIKKECLNDGSDKFIFFIWIFIPEINFQFWLKTLLWYTALMLPCCNEYS